MCGILGVVVGQKSNINLKDFKYIFNKLFVLSETRGKDAAGFALKIKNNIHVYKEPIRAKHLIKTPNYNKIFYNNLTSEKPLVAIGHVRLATNGSEQDNKNNQPIIKNGIIGTHNGIIVNNQELWQLFPELKKNYEIDTEIMLSILRKFLNEGNPLAKACGKTFSLINGYASVAFLFEDYNYLLLATNNGSLYTFCNNDLFVYSSEQYILKSLFKKANIENDEIQKINQLKPNKLLLLNLANLNQKIDDFSNINESNSSPAKIKKDKIIDNSPENIKRGGINILEKSQLSKFEDYYNLESKKINSLKRCTKCVLPETMPFIKFDINGVCNYCHNYKKIAIKGESEFEKILDNYRSKSNRPDCLVMFSGGRDSSYGLHLIKTRYKMNPIAYSYDWGMITDLARRNQSRMCGLLGIEHILVSANIRKKRANIKKNVLAWLKKPNLGTIPLFMAGDKQYFYHANKLKRQTNIKLIALCTNPLEKSDFKWGFCGVEPSPETHYKLSLQAKIKQAFFYGNNFAINPSYLNSSLLDSLGAYLSFYFISHNYINPYQFIKWNELEINSVLINQYDWETAEDTKNTWRIGDGTAPFYNYIYYILSGVTENDTFRSNQIREGALSRNEALEKSKQDNLPRFDSIKWYCDTIGIDFINTINKINSFKKLY